MALLLAPLVPRRPMACLGGHSPVLPPSLPPSLLPSPAILLFRTIFQEVVAIAAKNAALGVAQALLPTQSTTGREGPPSLVADRGSVDGAGPEL